MPAIRYAWVITRDDYASKAVNIRGPIEATDAEVEKARAEGLEFKMYDDDGELYFTGRAWSEDGDHRIFGPLDDWGMPDSGATEIRYPGPAGKLVKL